MALGVATQLSRRGLAVTSEQIAVATRNMSSSQSAGSSRKVANVITMGDGSPQLASVTRVSNQPLFLKAITATSAHGASRTAAAALNELTETILGDPANGGSVAATIDRLRDALLSQAADPSDSLRGGIAVGAAHDVADTLNSNAAAVRDLRSRLDKDIATTVAAVNTSLKDLEAVNRQILGTSSKGPELADALDARDQILIGMADLIGIKVLSRGDNDIVVTTESGAILFQSSARQLTFDPSVLMDGQPGNAVRVDGVDLTSPASTMVNSGGVLSGLVQARDRVAVKFGQQLDEIARGLIATFSEADQTGGAGPDMPGLFTWQGASTIPPAGVAVIGLAARIEVAAAVDPDQGGNVALLRDGGISGNPAYRYNTSGAAGFSDRLDELATAFDTVMNFDPAVAVLPSASVPSLARAALAWLADGVQSASRDDAYQSALESRAVELHTNATGIDLDQEMAHLLELERSYQASARLLATVGTMFDSLLAAIR